MRTENGITTEPRVKSVDNLKYFKLAVVSTPGSVPRVPRYLP